MVDSSIQLLCSETHVLFFSFRGQVGRCARGLVSYGISLFSCRADEERAAVEVSACAALWVVAWCYCWHLCSSDHG